MIERAAQIQRNWEAVARVDGCVSLISAHQQSLVTNTHKAILAHTHTNKISSLSHLYLSVKTKLNVLSSSLDEALSHTTDSKTKSLFYLREAFLRDNCAATTSEGFQMMNLTCTRFIKLACSFVGNLTSLYLL